jgi:hypothetical protein
MHGFETTVPVTLDMMILQGHAVMRGSKRALVVVDPTCRSRWRIRPPPNEDQDILKYLHIQAAGIFRLAILPRHATLTACNSFIRSSSPPAVSRQSPLPRPLGLLPSVSKKYLIFATEQAVDDRALDEENRARSVVVISQP